MFPFELHRSKKMYTNFPIHLYPYNIFSIVLYLKFNRINGSRNNINICKKQDVLISNVLLLKMVVRLSFLSKCKCFIQDAIIV